MKRFNLINSIFGWLVFAIGAYTYLMTLEKSGSFWDCGEFASCAYRLQVAHPAGAPLFLLIGRIFSLMAGNTVDSAHHVWNVATAINSLSGIMSALNVMFMFWIITHLARKVIKPEANGEYSNANLLAIMGAGLVGSLAMGWSDTFWFSAVEAEVYASSSFFTFLVFWAILKWENIADQKGADRWLILIGYFIGLAIGVHLLNLLVIPAIVLVYYFRKYEVNRKGLIFAIIAAVAILGFVNFIMIPWIPMLAAKFDLFFVNTLGMGFGTGVIVFALAFIALFVFGIMYSHEASDRNRYGVYISAGLLLLIGIISGSTVKMMAVMVIVFAAVGITFYFLNKRDRMMMNTMILAFAFMVIGYASYVQAIVRAKANPPINMNAPSDVWSFLGYINRDQYGELPLFYGPYYYAEPTGQDEGEMQYRIDRDSKTYKELGPKQTYTYDPKDCTILPRMHSSRADHVQAYKEWEKLGSRKPTFADNMDFMLTYQVGFMWWRYFAWNFIGRQSEEQGNGEVSNGNWISGIPFIDAAKGIKPGEPQSLKANKGRNLYYGLPFLIGILGMIWHFRANKKDAWVTLTLFFFTGVAIVLYLNFPPLQPRERDYAYVGSIQTFCIWIGLGVLFIYDYLRRKVNPTVVAVTATAACLLAGPVLMVARNWDDHDRSNRTISVDYAKCYLNSCDANAILFTNGDNDTYPLWYAQNIEGIRPDIRIINLSLLNTDWYVDALRHKVYDSEPVTMTMKPNQYVQGTRDQIFYYANKKLPDWVDLKTLMDFICNDANPETKVQMQQSPEQYSYYPTTHLSVKIDKEECKKNHIVSPDDEDKMVDSIRWDMPKDKYILKNDLVELDIIANNMNSRPIYWAITTGTEPYLGLQPYFQLDGFTYKLVPIKKQNNEEDPQTGRINLKKLDDVVMNKFTFGGLNHKGVYVDQTSMRQTYNFRNLFARLSDEWSMAGNKQRAVEVLDKCMTELPIENVPMTYYFLQIIESYYKAGALDKGKMYSDLLLKQCQDELRYYAKYAGKGFSRVKQDAEMDYRAFDMAYSIASRNGQTDYANQILKMQEEFKSLQGYFYQGQGR
jgi:hypothetical protein